MREYFLYILRCCDGSYYVGVTNNLEERILQHRRGDDPAAYTYWLRPVELVFSHSFDSINDAIAAEKQIKGWRRAKKEAVIRGDVDLLPFLAKKKFAHSRPL